MQVDALNQQWLSSGEEYDAPQTNGSKPVLRFKCFGNSVDVRTIEDNKRISVYHRCVTRAECEAYAYGFLGGFAEGEKFGEVKQSKEVARRLNLKLEI